MSVLRIAKMGNPVLLRKAEPVADPTSPEIRRLAAPQVFVSRRGSAHSSGRYFFSAAFFAAASSCGQ
jgi:hypothetical protein